MLIAMPSGRDVHVSDYFGLNKKQPQLDFVDVAVHFDTRLFVDPQALLLLNSVWAAQAVGLVQGFFTEVLDEISKGNDQRSQSMLSRLREPNETRLGLSKGAPAGRALGAGSAVKVWEALRRSQAVRSGIIDQLEDTILMVEGIGVDIVSDITTNLIRGPLITYTQDMCDLHGIPLTTDVVSGALWDPNLDDWTEQFTELPMVDGKPLLLVPKAIVRRWMEYDVDEYYRAYILPHLSDIEMSSPTIGLAKVVQGRRKRPTPKELQAKYGSGKRVVIEQTLAQPDLLDAYREVKRQKPRRRPLTHEELANDADVPAPDFDDLLAKVRAVKSGKEGAGAYHDAVLDLLTPLFYPELVSPYKEAPIHQGRKRIDIRFDNVGDPKSFFGWLGSRYTAPFVFVECKNYAGDPANPELDQLLGRFSPNRGRFGILICRTVKDRQRMQERCRDAASDDRGFIVVLDDDDLETLVAERKKQQRPRLRLLRSHFEALVM